MMSTRGRLERGSEIKPRGNKEGGKDNRLHSTLQPHEAFHASTHFSRVWQPMNVINHEYNITHKM